MDWAWGSQQLTSQVSRPKTVGFSSMGVDERNGTQREILDARRIVWSYFEWADGIRNSQRQLQQAAPAVYNGEARCISAEGEIIENMF
jgi:hypothetical protein